MIPVPEQVIEAINDPQQAEERSKEEAAEDDPDESEDSEASSSSGNTDSSDESYSSEESIRVVELPNEDHESKTREQEEKLADALVKYSPNAEI